MNKIKYLLNLEIKKTKYYLDTANSLMPNISGRLESKGSGRFAHRLNDGTRVSLNKSNTDLISKLAQKAYLKTTKSYLETQLRKLTFISNIFEETNIDDIFNYLGNNRKNLVNPIARTKDQRIKSFKSLKFPELHIEGYTKSIKTKRGEFVRSKSEKIIADLLFDLGIEYHYEMPLKLRDGKVVYPDFTILHPETLEIYYLEHLGMMDKSKYANDNVLKINLLHNSGIVLGDRLIITMETSENPLDVEACENLIRKTFLSWI